MKKIFLSISIGVAIASCKQPNVNQKLTGFIYSPSGKEISQIKIDGCQYIGRFVGSNSDWGTHKGNCNNPIHNMK